MGELKVPAENLVAYFEIPVDDMDRAIKFYTAVFNFSFDKQIIDRNAMAPFPFTDGQRGISSALPKGGAYKPTKDGVIIYFKTLDIESTLELAVKNNGHVLYSKSSIGELGFVAEFEGSEGNRIGLSPLKTIFRISVKGMNRTQMAIK